ncbi:MAG: hypothetical protein C0424_02630 [Sphingobacteriaceae bacterium]|nr:hypothetical protein [Sphingobacteriaceae bacterium]
MSEIRFSVVIPLFNKATTIVRSIESVLHQTLAAYEIIVVDNGSTDDGASLVNGIKDARIRLLQQVNQGVSAARNAGIAAATGTHIALLDADDAWAPGFLAAMQDLIAAQPEAGWFASGYAFRYEDGDKAPSHPTLEAFSAGLLPDYFAVVSQGDMVATASSVVLPANVLQQVGGFAEGERIGEDQDLWARIALQYPVAFDPAVFAYYYQDSPDMATKARVDTKEWPFIARLEKAGRTLPFERQKTLYQYLSRQLVGQASQLVLAREFDAAQKILGKPLAKISGLRWAYWQVRNYLHI